MKFKLNFNSSICGEFYYAGVWYDVPKGMKGDPLFENMKRRKQLVLDSEVETAAKGGAPETAMKAPAKKKAWTKKA